MIIFPTCKINLGLHVLEKRSDGFHNLETVMIETPWKDEIFFVEDQNERLEIEGLTIPGTDNIILKTLELARTIYPIPSLHIHLVKNIPMGAGLGGGSSDAAKFYFALSQTYFPDRTISQLESDIASIGSDCAFFIKGESQFCTGRGEILEPIRIDLKGMHCVLLNLGIHISTAEAFSLITPDKNRPSIKDIIAQPINTWKDNLVNDFEKSAFALYPELAQVKQQLYEKGAIYAAMTGSGSTLFGIFNDLNQATNFTIEEVKFSKVVTF